MTSPKFHCGGVSPPKSAHAACLAAPSATYSPGCGTSTSRPKSDDAIEEIANLRKTLSTTTDPQVKAEIEAGIKIQEAKVADITLRSQAKVNKLTEDGLLFA